MPNKHFYFAIGATHGAAIAAYVYYNRRAWYAKYRWVRRLYRWDRDWPLYLPLIMPLIGLWGLIPDILHGTGFLDKASTRLPFYDLFFFHSTFEMIEDSNKMLDHWLNTSGSILLFLLSMGLFVFYGKKARELLKESD